jgi:hypothetical protein
MLTASHGTSHQATRLPAGSRRQVFHKFQGQDEVKAIRGFMQQRSVARYDGCQIAGCEAGSWCSECDR